MLLCCKDYFRAIIFSADLRKLNYCSVFLLQPNGNFDINFDH